jgi:hypothetical protein
MARLRKADSGAFWFNENGLDLFFLAVCSLLMSAESPSHTHGQTGDERTKILHEGLGNVQPVLNANEKKKREREVLPVMLAVHMARDSWVSWLRLLFNRPFGDRKDSRRPQETPGSETPSFTMT